METVRQWWIRIAAATFLVAVYAAANPVIARAGEYAWGD